MRSDSHEASLPMSRTPAHIDFKLNDADREHVSRAAELRGVSLAAFVRDAVVREADRVVAAALLTTLEAGESRHPEQWAEARGGLEGGLRHAIARVGK